MSFGAIIRKLRLDKNMTQEQLAEVLSISAQAVSRWETNLALPDISLLPVLANYFDVTTDYLLEVDISKKEKEIDIWLEKAREQTSKGHWQKGIEILRNAVKQYPDQYKLLNELAYALYSSPQETETLSEEEYKKLLDEAVSIEESVLANSLETELKHSAIRLLCYAYPSLEMWDKAENLAATMPYINQCRETLLVSVSKGSKRFRYMQNSMLANIELLLTGITCNNAPLDDKAKPYTTEEMILLNKKAIDILNILFEDKKYGTFGENIAWIYLNIAWFYAKLKNRDEAIKHLKLAKEQAIASDKTPYNPEEQYTCLLFRGIEHGKIWHNITDNSSSHQIKEMSDKVYDFIRDDAEFQNITAELKKYASTY